MSGGCLFDNSGTTVSYHTGDGTWTTLGNLGLWSTDDYLKVNDIELNDDTLDALNYATTTLSVDKNECKIERIDNMNILDYYERTKRAEIAAKYEGIIDDEYNKLEVVDAYKTLIEEFEINLKQLADRYNTKEETFIERTGYEPDYAFELNSEIESNIREKHNADYNKEIEELSKFVEEIRAVLSLSNDKDYQLDVLKNYEILDKKGRINI